MSDNLKSQFFKLELISQLSSLKARKLLLSEFSKDIKFCKAVREIVKNTVRRNVRVGERDKRKLVKYKSLLLSLAKRQKNHDKMRRMIQQTGTGVFLPIVIPLVASLISSLVSK